MKNLSPKYERSTTLCCKDKWIRKSELQNYIPESKIRLIMMVSLQYPRFISGFKITKTKIVISLRSKCKIQSLRKCAHQIPEPRLKMIKFKINTMGFCHRFYSHKGKEYRYKSDTLLSNGGSTVSLILILFQIVGSPA